MANTKSALKRVRQNEVSRDRNRSHRSALRSAVKQVRSAVADGDASAAQEKLKVALKAIDSTASKGVIHRNAASRTKSRLTKAVNQLQA